MEKDRDQLTPDDPDDRAKIQQARGQGTGGTGLDRLPGEEAPAEFHNAGSTDDNVTDPLADS
jgi:hypothetical protein